MTPKFQSLKSRHAVALYRVSTAEQGHSGLGLEAQQASVRSFLTAQGWTLIGEFSDIAAARTTAAQGSKPLWPAASSWAPCWWPLDWIGSPGVPTRCRNYWRMASQSAPRTCRGPTI